MDNVKKLCIFDLDGTLVKGSSGLKLTNALRDNGIFNEHLWEKMMNLEKNYKSRLHILNYYDEYICKLSTYFAKGLSGARVEDVEKVAREVISQTVRVTPEKGSEPRALRISAKCLSMLQSLPRKGSLIFGGYPIRGFAKSFQRSRKILANKLGNPRLLQISFHTFRHWKATMEYARTKDILHVMKLLGHKNIKNTLIYTQLTNFKEDEWVCKVARTVEEAKQLIEAGFEYVDTIDGFHLYRKRR
ncbi:MAG: tyrosine-type recombinase/integrase [Nitrososphaeria archaeon]